MLQKNIDNIVIINAQDVEYCTTADKGNVENRSLIISVLHVINLVYFSLNTHDIKPKSNDHIRK